MRAYAPGVCCVAQPSLNIYVYYLPVRVRVVVGGSHKKRLNGSELPMTTSENEHAERFKTCVREMRARARDRIDPTTGAVAVRAVGQPTCLFARPHQFYPGEYSLFHLLLYNTLSLVFFNGFSILSPLFFASNSP